MHDFPHKDRYTIDDLRAIVTILRGEDGCPWDREQTHQSIRRDLIEETYEAVEAIDLHNPVLLREELGDVLLQVVFHSRIEEEESRFDLDDVITDVCRKLIIRHPHVFSDTEVHSTDEVLKNWEAIKNKTKGTGSYTETLTLVPKVYPALVRAQKVTKRASAVGFCMTDFSAAWIDLQDELRELAAAVEGEGPDAVKDELGDVLFACANVARHLGLDAEEALSFSVDKFIRRFAKVEEYARGEGIDLAKASDEQRRVWWRRAKES